MKVLCLVVLLCAVSVYAKKEEKRQAALLATFAPVIGKFLADKLHISEWIGKAVGSISGLIKGKSGDITVPNTTLKLHYSVGRCHLKGRKRILLHESCTATVSENAITKTSSSCTTHVQSSAIQCAMEAELKKIQALANKAAGR
ncbi:hypothetical protein SNE40_000730 [Patella caerulea]|uniref:Uncharacterized protein n=1 Tax=Patella caerulea TaxID=87958 RepID=A0AAN8KH43_PATCE